MLFYRFLMIGWRKIWQILKPWRGVLCFHFRVCLSVRLRVTGHIFWPRNLIFGLKDPWDMRKNSIFCFSKFWKMGFLGPFSLSCLSVSELQRTPFGLRTWFLDWRVLGTWERNAFFCFSKFWKMGFLGPFSLKRCVSELQSTTFGLETWFLDWRILGTWERNAFFCFSKFWKMTFLGLFLCFTFVSVCLRATEDTF